MPKKRKPTVQQEEYVKRIKDELILAFQNTPFNISQLHAHLEEKYGFNINKGTLTQLFNRDNPNIDYVSLITLCTLFGFDLNTLLKPKEVMSSPYQMGNLGAAVEQIYQENQKSSPSTQQDSFLQSILAVRDHFPVLEDDGYTGDYVGFIMSPTADSISQFTLSLKKDDDQVMQATFIRTSSKKSNNPRQYVFRGIPLYAKAYKAILLFLTDVKDNGEFYFLAFGFQKYRGGSKLIYRKGLAITGRSFNAATIISQNFVLFKSGLEEPFLKYIPGLLKAPTGDICISLEEVKKLRKQHKEVDVFLNELSDAMQRRTREMLILNEENILTLDSELPKDIRYKALLLLKSKAIIGSKNYYKAEGTYSPFITSEETRSQSDQ